RVAVHLARRLPEGPPAELGRRGGAGARRASDRALRCARAFIGCDDRHRPVSLRDGSRAREPGSGDAPPRHDESFLGLFNTMMYRGVRSFLSLLLVFTLFVAAVGLGRGGP